MRDTSLQYEDAIIPELDIYAIPSKEGTFSRYTDNRALKWTYRIQFVIEILIFLI